MKNIVPHAGDTFSFHKKVIEKKRHAPTDTDYKIRVSSYNDVVESKFKIFEDKFKNDKLEELVPEGYTGVEKDTLHNLYKFKSKLLQDLKVELTTTHTNRIVNTCQNCTISEVNSFDHFLPKEEFAEFSVNPKNLFPSCTKCNSYKGDIWREHNKRVFLNLYLDELPNEQYLFVDIVVNSAEIDLTYKLDNINNIEDNLYNLIKNHYEKLYLCQRFKENSAEVVSELDIEINKYKAELSIDKIKNVVIEECNEYKKVFGYNYWKAILKMSLINNPGYMSRF